MFARWTGVLALGLIIAFFGAAVGCSKDDKGGQAKAEKKDDKKKDEPHEEWWCQEHGVPEDMCSLCLPDAKVKEMFKDKGDWCKIHERAQSQCFKCDPTLYKKYEDLYVAKSKYNKKPEPPPPAEFKK